MLAIGVNPGYGNFKMVVNDGTANERSIVFPSIVAKAQRQVAGAIDKIPVVQIDDQGFWVGEDALIGDHRTNISMARLNDQYFIPALVRAGLERLNIPREPSVAVTGLPAGWADDIELAKNLGALLRVAAAHTFSGAKIRVVSEPLGVLYSQAINHAGVRVQSELTTGRVLIVDIGHYTVNAVIVKNQRPEPASSYSFDSGTSTFLGRIGQVIFAAYGMQLSLFEVDQAIRNRGLLVSGEFQPLPAKVQLILAEAGTKIAAHLVEMLRGGTDIQKVLIAGGGAELQALTDPIVDKFKQSLVLPNPQLAVATGMARLARYNINKAGQ